MDVRKYLIRCLDSALNAGDQESSYNNSFDVKVKQNGFAFVPRFPAGFVLSEDLYQKIYQIAAAALYPEYTLLKQTSIFYIPLPDQPMEVKRALWYPWIVGSPKRLNIGNLKNYFKRKNSSSDRKYTIPLMHGYSVDFRKITSVAIAGTTGSGKSMLLTYLLSALEPLSRLIVVDPKFDKPARWARDHGITAISPGVNSSKSDFVSAVNDELSQALQVIFKRQRVLYENPNQEFEPVSIIIDELAALTIGINRTVRDAFLSLLSQIALLGRGTSVKLLLVSQRFDHTVMPTAIRDQLNVMIELGNINRKTVQFLFPDLDPTGIVIPQGPGTGVIQIIDDSHYDNVLPFLAPTYCAEE